MDDEYYTLTVSFNLYSETGKRLPEAVKKLTTDTWREGRYDQDQEAICFIIESVLKNLGADVMVCNGRPVAATLNKGSIEI